MEKKIEIDYTHTNFQLSKPVLYDGAEVRELTFDWGSLTGKDALKIETEANTRRKIVNNPAFSVEYLIGMAVRACEPEVDRDFFLRMPLGDFNRVRGAARDFLLYSDFLWKTPEDGSDDNA